MRSKPSSPFLLNQPAPSLPQRRAFSWRTALLLALLPIAALLALPGLAIGALTWWRTSTTWDYRERLAGTWLLAIIGLVVYAAIIWVAHPLPTLFHTLLVDRQKSNLVVGLRAVGELWLLHLCFAPACALILEGLHPLTRRVRLLPRYRVPRCGEGGGSSPAHPPSSSRSLVPLPPPSPSSPPSSSVLPPSPVSQLPAVQLPLTDPLGIFLGGDLCEWLRGGQLCLPCEEMWRHGTVVGEPGFGKTMTLLRLATIAARYGMQVIFLDLKGSQQTAAHFVAAMQLIGVGRVAVYPQQAYDGWRGDATALYSRLLAMIDPGTHPYYRRVTAALVSLAVQAPGGPPRNSQEFLARLDMRWLKCAYAGKSHWYAQRKIYKLSAQIDENSLAYDGFFDGVAGGLDGSFAYEDADAIYIGLDGDALKEQAVTMARYLLEDAAHYAKHRKAPGVRTLCIIDEFGALGISNVVGLYERMREAGLSMWASAQSYAGLGPERESVLAASSIKILHRCGDPRELVRYAGEREVPAFSHLLEEENEAGPFGPAGGEDQSGRRRTAVRMQRQYAMPVEAVQQLGVGTVGLISGGLGAWCQVSPLGLPEDLVRAALTEVAGPKVASPPTQEPIAPGQATHSSSDLPAQQPARDRGRGAKKGPRRSGAPPVPVVQAPQTVPGQPPPGGAALAPTATAESGRPVPVLPAGEDDSPVDF